MSEHKFVATAQNFMSDVVEASKTRPVLVDFWADWCGPCKQLMPVLDRLADEYAGRFALAKVNTDEQQELAGQVGVRSLPTVVLFKGGQMVDHFVGALPENQVRQLLDRHVPAPAQSPLERARQLKADGQYQAAIEEIGPSVQSDPANIGLQCELGELQALAGDIDSARQILTSVQSREPKAQPVRRLDATIHFKSLAQGVLNAPSESRAEADDVSSRLAQSAQSLLKGDIEAALQELLSLLRSASGKKDDRVRKSLLLAFEYLDKDDPRVAEYRRAMAGLLF